MNARADFTLPASFVDIGAQYRALDLQSLQDSRNVLAVARRLHLPRAHIKQQQSSVVRQYLRLRRTRR